LRLRQFLFHNNPYFVGIIEAILFDLSGTLVDDLYAVYMGFLDLCKTSDKIPLPLSQFRKEFRLPYAEFLKEKQFDNIRYAIDFWKACYAHYGDSISLFSDVKPALELLQEFSNVKLGVVSQTPEDLIKMNLERFDIREFFYERAIICDKWKPGPEGLLLSIDKLQVNYHAIIIYVGDMREDMYAAWSANRVTEPRGLKILPVGVYRDNGSFHDLETLKYGNPICIIKNLTELIPLVQVSEAPLTAKI